MKNIDTIDEDNLTRALDRIALYFESNDPRLRAECTRITRQNIKQTVKEINKAE